MKEARDLLEKFKAGKCSPKELAILHRWIHDLNADAPSSLSEADLLHHTKEFENYFQNTHTPNTPVKELKAEPQHPKIKRIRPLRIAAAAVILISLGMGMYFFQQQTPAEQSITKNNKEDVEPGGDRATLTLGNGKKIELNDLAMGTDIDFGVSLSEQEKGELVYDNPKITDNREISYHLLETPLKGQYRVSLPDGSKVWLNSVSSLRFPSHFPNDQRIVELTGEAYFEIEKDAKRPFIVKTKNQNVTVLGTHFNIKSYADEIFCNTTLIEGSVRVTPTLLYSNQERSTILVPGQQSRLSSNKMLVKEVDVEQVIDWKNGDFIFKQENLINILRRVSRWYGISFVYQKDIDLSQTFTGQISRLKNLSELTHILEATSDLSFTLKNNTIQITKKTNL